MQRINIDAPETHECPECEAIIDPEDGDCQWSNIYDTYYCWSCYESDVQYASTVTVVDDGAVDKFTVADAFVFDENGEDPRHLTFKRSYTSTDDWRGYYSVDISGPSGDWVEVLSGWTTGGWDDSTARRKQEFNDWALDLTTGELFPPCAVALVTNPTSNLFSTAVSVLVPATSVDTFNDWLGEDTDSLKYSLS